MWDSLLKLVLEVAVGAAVATAVAVVIYKWDDIRESVADWLRRNNLSTSAIMDAWIKFDKIVSNIKMKIFVKTSQTGVQEIKEMTVSAEQLKKEDPDVYEELQRRGYAQKNILNQIA